MCRLTYTYFIFVRFVSKTFFQAFNSMQTVALMQPFHVHYIGEVSVGGGLISDFYAAFFEGVCRRCVRITPFLSLPFFITSYYFSIMTQMFSRVALVTRFLVFFVDGFAAQSFAKSVSVLPRIAKYRPP